MLCPAVLFIHSADLTDSSAPSAAKSENTVQESIPRDVRHATAGFPCTDASRLNAKARANRGCIAESSDQTGSVFHDIIGFVLVYGHQLLFLTLENVTPLLYPPVDEDDKTTITGPCNVDVIIFVISTVLCFHVILHKLDPRYYGSPQSRHRLYFNCFPRTALEALELSDEEATTRFCAIMDRLSGSQITHLDEYLLDGSDPRVAGPSAIALEAKLTELADPQE